ncbi:MAG: preprotein translocase subunit YajC [Ruminococcaceae bacterium]|nr:preprotein translocase subunit YajC [Oscillospiraceae bacterium]
MGTLIYFVVIIAIMYFLLFRPEKKRKKQQQEMRDSLKIGDTITTIGGIVGTIVDVDKELIVIETGEDRVRIQLARWAVGSIGKAAEETN